MTRRVVVTGATGFLGGSIIEALRDEPEVEVVAACRDAGRLPAGFAGEVRVGDLSDPSYRRAVLAGADVVCHAAATAAMWGHAHDEKRSFFEPARDLVRLATETGVRFVMAGTVVMGAPGTAAVPAGDDSTLARRPGFWPHLDRLIELDRAMLASARPGASMVMLRLGHFVGRGNRIGMLPALLPRLRTRLVPWLDGGRRRLPLIGPSDLGRAFARASMAEGLDGYESFNICGPEFPTLREVIGHIAAETGLPAPRVSVPFGVGFGAGRAMEALPLVLPGKSPFLTRSIVHLCDNWVCDTEKARTRLGYVPAEDWRKALAPQLAELAAAGFPWPRLSQYPRSSTWFTLRRNDGRPRSRRARSTDPRLPGGAAAQDAGRDPRNIPG